MSRAGEATRVERYPAGLGSTDPAVVELRAELYALLHQLDTGDAKLVVLDSIRLKLVELRKALRHESR